MYKKKSKIMSSVKKFYVKRPRAFFKKLFYVLTLKNCCNIALSNLCNCSTQIIIELQDARVIFISYEENIVNNFNN